MPGMELAALAAVDTGATTAEVAEVQAGARGTVPDACGEVSSSRLRRHSGMELPRLTGLAA